MTLAVDLSGRVALVTGGSRGIGRGIAAVLAREGARVAVASRSRERLEEAAVAIRTAEATLAQEGGSASVTPFVADAADLERLAELPGEVEAALGPVEILVANTGGPPFGGALDHGLDEWERAYRSLVLAPRVLAGAVVPGMRERGWGRIVNVGSTTTREPNPALNLSNSHRMAAVGFLKTLATEVAGDGVTVNSVQPGSHDTDRIRSLYGGDTSGAAAGIPAGVLGDPADFGAVVAFLCSQQARFVTGAHVHVDGGAYRGLQ
jgi:3-oxoacyl-[acyl-carrier protein] reductase